MYMDGAYLEKLYKSLKYGDEIRIVRDLSMGAMDPDMIQELGLRFFKENQEDILYILRNFPIIDFSLLK